MFYFIITVLFLSYYLFLAPKSIKNTMTTITRVGMLALVIILMMMTYHKIVQSPPEVLLGIAMIIFAYFPLKDMFQTSQHPAPKWLVRWQRGMILNWKRFVRGVQIYRKKRRRGKLRKR